MAVGVIESDRNCIIYKHFKQKLFPQSKTDKEVSVSVCTVAL